MNWQAVGIAAALGSMASWALGASAPPVWTPAPETRFYGGAEYLLWWVKDAPLSVPLVSTGPIATTHHGLLASPDTTILYGAPHYPSSGGNDTQAFQAFSGARLTLGYALDDKHRFAIEVSGFSLQQQSAGYEARGDSTGNPVLGIPVYNSVAYSIGTMTISPGEDSLPFALPDDALRSRANGIITGGVKITNKLQLWGTEAVGVISLYRKPSWELSGLVGLRYLDLYENFKITSDIEGVTGPYARQSGVVTDKFDTQNQFFGGLIGLRGRYSEGSLSVDLAARVSLGVTHQIEDIAGGFVASNFPAGTTTGPEGIFAQPANEGRTSATKFSVVPDLQIKIGYAITPRLRATIGYDFLYYGGVLRPGDQINRNTPKGQTFNQADPTISTTSPTRLFKTSDFFAHGLSFGMEFRF